MALRLGKRTLRTFRPLAHRLQVRHASAAPFKYEELFDLHANEVPTEYRKLSSDGISTCTVSSGEKLLKVESHVLESMTHEAIVDVQHLFRPAHLQMLSNILKDPEASSNDRFVALELLKNACVSAGKVMPSCQDTGTAIAMVKRGTHVLTDGRDEEFISRGVYKAYSEGYLRYSQVAPLSMFEEANTKTNLPAQIDMLSQHGNTYDVLYIAKGGGSANKTQLLQKTKGVLNDKAFMDFVTEQVQNIGTAACPPYHLALVVGGLSAEQNLKTVKLASCKYLDGLPTSGNKFGRAFRDVEWEEKIRTLSQELGIGAQFGGKYFLHDVRVVRLPRHGASCPVGIGVSCSADRQAKAKITEEGVFLEKLETDPAKYLPDITEKSLEKGGEIVKVDLNKPMEENLKYLSQFPVSTRLALTGTIIVARDIAHAKMQEMLDNGKGLPDYIKQYPVYYAGPAKTPAGMPSGSFGPTTSGRMDQYVGTFQSQRGSMIMIGKGNRSKDVTDACKKHGGFYLGSIGGVAATLSANSIKKVEVLDMEELGMEAVWKIEVEDFPAFVVVDNKGNDFFEKWSKEAAKAPEEDSFFDEAKNFFHGLDKDQNGKLDVNEIMAGLSIDRAKAEKLVQQFDVDSDGVIDVKEFELMLLKNEALREQLH